MVAARVDDEPTGEESDEQVRAREEREFREGRYHRLSRKTVKYEYDQDPIIRPMFPGGLDSPRNVLVDALACAVGDDALAARVVGALDAYLEDHPADRSMQLLFLPPNHEAEAIRQRARAEKAEALIR